MRSSAEQPASTEDEVAISRVLRRVGWRILPLLLLLYFIAYLDRVNIGFAAQRMQRDLHFSDSLYGTGAGLFFIGYMLAQIPSNLLLYRIGARRMMGILMIVWGTISGSMAFVHTPIPFLTLRFLLGVAEAGFYPGVILYLTLWLPRRVRTSFTAWFIFAIPLANIFGGPLSTLILQHGNVGAMRDWQVLLLTEAIPAVVMGFLLPWLMTDTPKAAEWLAEPDRVLLAEVRARDEYPSTNHEDTGTQDTDSKRFSIGSPVRILLFSTIYFAIQFSLYAQGFWLPLILERMGVSPRSVGWQVAAVYVVSAVGMLVWGRMADRGASKKWTLAVPLLIAAVGYALTPLAIHASTGLAVVIVIVTFGAGSAGALAATAPFWAQVTLGENALTAAGMIATINALGNLGGFAGPALLGRLQQTSGNYATGMLTAGVALALAAAIFVKGQRRSP